MVFECAKQFILVLLFILLFSIQTTVNLLLPHLKYECCDSYLRWQLKCRDIIEIKIHWIWVMNKSKTYTNQAVEFLNDQNWVRFQVKVFDWRSLEFAFLKNWALTCVSVGWMLSCKAKGCQFDSQPGHMLVCTLNGVRSPFGAHMRGNLSMFLNMVFPSLSSSLPLSVKVNK